MQVSAILDYVQQLAEEIKLHFLEGAQAEAISSASAKMEQAAKADTAAVASPPRPKRRTKFGKGRDMTIERVRAVVAACLRYMAEGYSARQFYDDQHLEPGEPYFYEYNTMHGWLYDARFRPEDM